MAANRPKWVLLDGRFHRVDPGSLPLETLCKRAVPDSATLKSAAEVMIQIRAERTSVCGSCDREYDRINWRVSGREPVRLTLEQQEVAESIKADRERRRRLRNQLEADTESRQQDKSVRALNGGLPGLGKRR
jgi:hypothetical protein